MSRITHQVWSLLGLALLAVAAARPAPAQVQFPTPNGAISTGQVQMCLNASGMSVPVSAGTCAAGQAVTLSGPLPAGTNSIGTALTPFTGIVTNPTSTLTRPANTTAYAATRLVGSSTTAGSVVVPSFSIATAAGSVAIPRLRLATNATTGWGTTLTVNLWSAAPTYANGDGGTYAVATNGAKHLAQFSCTLTQYGDAASGECSISGGNFALITLASGTSIFWDLQTTASATPVSGQTFTLIPELAN